MMRLALGLALAAGITLGYQQASAPAVTTRGPAVQAAQAPRALPSRPPVMPGPVGSDTVLPLGDSITMGADSTTGCGYRCPLEQLLVQSGQSVHWVGTQRDATGHAHEGHSGWRIDQLADNARAWAALTRPRVVLVHGGTNDDGQNATGAEMLARMSRLLDEIAAGCPGTVVIVAKIQLTTYNTALQQQQQVIFNAGLDALAAGKAPGLRVRTVNMAAAGVQMPGGIHPNDVGYATMAQVWAPALLAALGGASAS